MLWSLCVLRVRRWPNVLTVQQLDGVELIEAIGMRAYML